MTTYYSPDRYKNRLTADEVRALTGPAVDRLAQYWDDLVHVMEDEAREAVHAEVDDQCTHKDFLARYLEVATEPLAVVGGRYRVRRGQPGTRGVHAPPRK